MNIQPDDRILDFGCGTGRNACLMARYLSPGGKVVGLDISEIMGEHFEKKCRRYPNLEFRQQRIDQSFDLGEEYDKVFMSFVFHGFPQEVRHTILENALGHLRKGGTLNILDYAEFDVRSTPLWFRIPFNMLEGKCKYAFDYIEKDWKTILPRYGFGHFDEDFFIRGHLRLLKAEKIE
jgi:demethylmenaquinone methyltransferase/2-methoxy-6-polyprenyl-1,4-benzoquinol methylase